MGGQRLPFEPIAGQTSELRATRPEQAPDAQINAMPTVRSESTNQLFVACVPSRFVILSPLRKYEPCASTFQVKPW